MYQLQFLLAKEETRDALFVGFTDVTTAADTYGGGRYIDCVIGDIHNGLMILDFNNDLSVAILAGEKNYGKKIH